MDCFPTKRCSSPKLTEEDLDFLATNTDSNRQQLEAQFENFITKHPNGSISRKDFRTIMKTCFPHKQYEALEKRIFNMYDENRDGHISFKEFMFVLFVMANGTPEENLKQIFRVFDVDGDGSISRKEMKKIVSEIFHLLQQEEQQQQQQQQGDSPERRQPLPSKKDLSESAFREMDANNDGRVSQEEFVRAVMSHEKMASMLALKIVQVFDPDKI